MIEMIIWFDMDGVLADFDLEFYNISKNIWKEGIEKNWKEKWKIINQHPEFFLNLPWVEGSKELWDYCEGMDRRILSASNPICPPSVPQKHQWCLRELGISGDPVVIVKNKKEKAYYATPDGILIDDKLENITQWEDAGGVGILFENSQQALNELKKLIEG